jgi:tRNA(Ile)-lysidine synthase
MRLVQPFSLHALRRSLASLDVAEDASLCVAFSGGLDSTVLLHALTQLRQEGAAFRLRAVHVDHQIHESSRAWRAHCEAVAAALGAAFEAVSVDVHPQDDGLEAAARRARYDVLRERLAHGEALLTAHHADDQLESVLLALVRGAGVAGLSGVRPAQAFGRGRLLRPLLTFTRADLEGWARLQGLAWIEDPSNENLDLDRNFLRARVAPLLRERWSGAARGAARSAAHLEEARVVLEAAGRDDFERTAVDGRLDVERLLRLDAARRRNLLRTWMRMCGVKTPSTRKLLAIERDLLTAGADRTPCVSWDEVELRRHRGVLYLERRLAARPDADVSWDARQALQLPGDLGFLSLRADPAGPIDARKLGRELSVRFRAGGERLRPAGELHRRSLKKMLQAAGVPPWKRERLPLVYAGERLAAVGDLWVADEFAAQTTEHAARIVWERSGSRIADRGQSE